MITISDLKQQIEDGSRPLGLVNEAISRLQNSAQFNTIISGEEMFKLARERAELLEKLSLKLLVKRVNFTEFLSSLKITF